MADLWLRSEGMAGRITLTRPKALNALNHGMCLAIEAALDEWRNDPAIRLVLIDAEGDRAFCAGGDVAAVWHAAKAGDPRAGRGFWRDEYRMNAKLAEYPKPLVSLMQGFVMGGGVGLGCHIPHRIVAENLQMAMPEANIGLIPDVGGTLLLQRAPGGIGRYLGLTAARMGPGDAIHAGFADHMVAVQDWPDLIATLCDSGDVGRIADHAKPRPASTMAKNAAAIDAAFATDDIGAIAANLDRIGTGWAVDAAASLRRNSPLSMACTLQLLRSIEPGAGIRQALTNEYRFTWRAAEQGATDFTEGVRAQLVDKDRSPRWRHPSPMAVSDAEIAALLRPLGAEDLDFNG